jgi:hypothetical protein
MFYIYNITIKQNAMKASHKSVCKVANILIKHGLDQDFDKNQAIMIVSQFVSYGKSIIIIKQKEVRSEIKFILNKKSLIYKL